MEIARRKIEESAKIEHHLKRQMVTAAIISTELQKRGTDIVMVGGSATEFYTLANYLTSDIDFVATKNDHLKEVMEGLGFENEGGTWSYSGENVLLVEFVKGPLDGSWERLQTVTGPDNTSVKVIGIEDIIIDRASAVRYWKDPEEWAIYLMAANYEQINWDYLNKRAKEMDCAEIIRHGKKIAKNQFKQLLKEDIKRDRIQNIIQDKSDTFACVGNKYIKFAKDIIQRNRRWPGPGADIEIVQKLLLANYSTVKIGDTIAKLSPETGNQDNARQYINNTLKAALTPEIKKQLNRER